MRLSKIVIHVAGGVLVAFARVRDDFAAFDFLPARTFLARSTLRAVRSSGFSGRIKGEKLVQPQQSLAVHLVAGQ